MPFIDLIFYTFLAVLGILVMIAAGAVLVRTETLHDNTLNELGKVVMRVMLPAMLFTKFIAVDHLAKAFSENWIFIVGLLFFTALGFVIAYWVARIIKVHENDVRPVMCATALCNGGYMPLGMVTMICLIFPQFNGRNDDGVLMIISGMMVMIPLIWIVGYSILLNVPLRERSLKQILTPPVYALMLGIVCGLLIDALHLHPYFMQSDAVLFPVYKGFSWLGDCCIPCVMLILGGKLAQRRPFTQIQKRARSATVLLRLIVVPAIYFGIVYVAWCAGWLGHDAFVPLMLVLVGAMPPSNDLVVIATQKSDIEGTMASLNFYAYIASILTIPFFISLAIHLFR